MSETTWRLVTVNTAPERAKRLIGRVAEDLKDQYTILHVANADCKYRRLQFYPNVEIPTMLT